MPLPLILTNPAWKVILKDSAIKSKHSQASWLYLPVECRLGCVLGEAGGGRWGSWAEASESGAGPCALVSGLPLWGPFSARAGPGESGRSHTDGPVLLSPGSPLSDPGGGGARCGLLSLVPRLWDSRQADAPRSGAPASTWGRALAECRGGQS